MNVFLPMRSLQYVLWGVLLGLVLAGSCLGSTVVGEDVSGQNEALSGGTVARGWQSGGYFKLEKQNGRWVFLDPNEKPFYSVGMVYAYGPEFGPAKSQMTAEKVLAELQKMKEAGFNTLDLYGRSFLDEILEWCDRNEFGVYLRTSYTEIRGLSPERIEFPDFMDPNFRTEAKNFMASVMSDIQDYHSVLAVDMDQRWLFSVDWEGGRRIGEPRLGPEAIQYFPKWLEKRYGNIAQINLAWQKQYAQFTDVLADGSVIQGENIPNSVNQPWRLDLVEYALWTVNDFLKDLTSTMRSVNPNHLITITTELPEVIPFQISNRENSGVDFLSPVHYNHISDFNRDWIGNARLIAQSKFQSDLSGLPSYINETGFRTHPLHQRPPNMNYAMSRASDDQHKAQLYLDQSSVMNIYPWLLGWSYFKWYDKWPEGDFGYIKNDGSLRAISQVGNLANPLFQINWDPEKSPRAIIFYPSYALAAPKASLQQHKSLVSHLENSFLKSHQKMVLDAMSILSSAQGTEDLSVSLFTQLKPAFDSEWFPFKFSRDLNSSSTILLAGGALEMLSGPDRARLMNLKTISLGPIGLFDERFRTLSPWYLDAVGVPSHAGEGRFVPQDIGLNSISSEDVWVKAVQGTTKFIEPSFEDNGLKRISCEGQEIKVKAGVYSSVEFLAASVEGDLADQVTLVYQDGTKETKYLSVSVGDFRFIPTFNKIGWKGKVQDDQFGYLSHVKVACNVSKTLVGLLLPKQPAIKVFAITLVEGGESSNIKVGVNWNGKRSEGVTYWALPLREGQGKFNTIATFDNGLPAVIESLDGKHIAFLYDPLTWKKPSGEMSAEKDFHEQLIKELLRKLEQS